jgi:sec-independent protein translocase protein TatB
MFGVDSTEFAVVAILALIFIGPKDLPKVLRTVGYWVGRVRGMARHFTSGIENMVREAELEEMEKKWREENERIMRLNPPNVHYPEPGEPDEMPPVANPEAGEEAPPPASGRSPSNDGEDIPPEKRPLP